MQPNTSAMPSTRPRNADSVLATPVPIKRRFPLNESHLNQTKLLKHYKSLSYKFELTTRSFMIIRRIVTDHNIPPSIRIRSCS